MKFKSLQRGDSVFTLERDRRSMYPIFDRAKVVKVGESKPRANENGDGFSNLIEIVLQDSIGTVTVYLPSDGNEGIYNNVTIKGRLSHVTVTNSQNRVVNLAHEAGAPILKPQSSGKLLATQTATLFSYRFQSPHLQAFMATQFSNFKRAAVS